MIASAIMRWISFAGCAFAMGPIVAGLVVTAREYLPPRVLLLREEWAVPSLETTRP